ncbi:MAG: class I SAM-dependent methyltransferase [Hyphomicrobiales bacterium]
MSRKLQCEKPFTDALQFMWGEGFLSPGGPEEVTRMLDGVDIRGREVLDIGSGLGGVDLLLAGVHGAGRVIGIDVEEPLVAAARALVEANPVTDRIEFRLVEPGPLPFADQTFDVVFSKDAMVHIPDKATLYREVLRVLRPGGWFIAADWLWAPGAGESAVVRKWLANGPLTFVFTTVAEAQAALVAAGFGDVAVRDERRRLQESNRVEIRTLEGPARERLAEIVGPERADVRLAMAHLRQGALDEGQLIPSHFRGRKPYA